MSEQMYLKCVKGIVSGTTVGDIRKVWWNNKSHGWEMEDPKDPSLPWTFDMDKKEIKGCECFFEIIEEEPKLTPRSLGCFQEVADVIGEANAVVELQKVIDCSEDTVWEESDQGLVECFIWKTSPQGDDFWFEICQGNVPEQLQTKAQPKSSPVFGDVLHINGNAFVFWRMEGVTYVVVREDYSNPIHVDSLHEFDEYKPNKSQELRNRILERWQKKSLDNAYDTLVCRTEISVGYLVDFVVENIEDEFGE